MHIGCRKSFCKDLQFLYFFFRHGKLLFVELVMGSDSACILVHDFLHGFLEFLNGKCRVLLCEKCIILGNFIFKNRFFIRSRRICHLFFV